MQKKMGFRIIFQLELLITHKHISIDSNKGNIGNSIPCSIYTCDPCRNHQKKAPKMMMTISSFKTELYRNHLNSFFPSLPAGHTLKGVRLHLFNFSNSMRLVWKPYPREMADWLAGSWITLALTGNHTVRKLF